MKTISIKITLKIFLILIFTKSLFANESHLIDGKFLLHLREQKSNKPIYHEELWKPSETAIIVCDMWDCHPWYNVSKRVYDMAPHANKVLQATRKAGIALIIHAPSQCMKFYANHPARLHAINIPTAKNFPKSMNMRGTPTSREQNCQLPIKCGNEDTAEELQNWTQHLKKQGKNPKEPWTRQCDLLEIQDKDAITDRGSEVWNLLEHYKIKNIIFFGVAANMCVINRPFGLRNLVNHHRNVVLVRDLTDSVCQSTPTMNHHTGTDLMIKHIESYICPTILSSDLTNEKPFKFSDDKR